SQYVGMGRDLISTFPQAFHVLETANKKYETAGRLTDFIFPLPGHSEEEKQIQDKMLRQTENAQPAIGAVSLAMLKILQVFGVKPEATCGHSFGELTALCAAGWIDEETFFDLSMSRGNLMASAGRDKRNGNGIMLAVNAPLNELDSLIEEMDTEVILANRNSPVQGVLSGSTDEIAKIETACKQKGYRTKRLPVSAAFHSRFVKDAQEPFMDIVRKIHMVPSETPVLSNTTGKPYPADPEAAKILLGEQLAKPVNFMEEVENLYGMGFRTFIEVGPRSILTGLVKSILPDRDVTAISLDHSSGRQFGVADLARLLCHVGAAGYPVDFSLWEQPVKEPEKQIMSIPISGVNYRSPNPKACSGVSKPVEDGHVSRKQIRTPVGKIEVPSDRNRQKMDNRQSKKPDVIANAFQVVQEGLKSMQSLQKQTAETHKKFLETQAEATRTLQKMMEKTQRLAEASLDIKPEFSIPEIPDHYRHQEQEEAVLPVEATGILRADTAATLSSDTQKDLERTMLETVSRLTGYPVEMIGLDMDIEADLGIDSIKRVEILSALEEKMPDLPSVSPEHMGSLKTLGQISEYLSDRTHAESHQPLVETGPACSPVGYSETDSYVSEGLSDNIERRTVSIKETPSHPGEGLSIPAGRKIYITDDGTGLAKAISQAFSASEIETVLISPDAVSEPKGISRAAGLIIIPNLQSELKASDLRDAVLMAKLAAPELLESGKSGHAVFATISRMDGTFGFKRTNNFDPMQGGLAGLAKTAAAEWKGVICRAIDIALDWEEVEEIAQAVVRELSTPDPSGPVEIGLGRNSRIFLQLSPSGHSPGQEIPIDLTPGDPVIVTGGARGVTAAATLALAKYARPLLVLLGRSPHPVPEPAWLASLTDEADIKKAILDNEYADNSASPMQIEQNFKKHMANREISMNLEKMRQTGASVLYYSVDIRDPESVQKILDEVRAKHGLIKGIIHGAGVLEDRFIIDKTSEQFEKVFETKVTGLRVLLEAAKQDPLKHIVLFSSVSARFGNKGQVDYAMANEVLNKTAQQESMKRP
ncbi:MAG: SDR family NAD(P)-dependent oxidoreductase, partial [Deltaproteobacteria bacterium]|nr:SDR family NAD(P)-dependent oxidoreductase [Deltaproteobacteria bacterium]